MAARWFRSATNKEPAMMLSAIIGVGAIAIPLVVVPIRRELGLPTYQWDGDASHPLLNDFSVAHKPQWFGDADRLVEYSQHGAYEYEQRLTPRERDFPAARRRLEERRLG